MAIKVPKLFACIMTLTIVYATTTVAQNASPELTVDTIEPVTEKAAPTAGYNGGFSFKAPTSSSS